MNRRGARILKDKKGLEILKTLVYIIVALGIVLIFGWAVISAAVKIFK